MQTCLPKRLKQATLAATRPQVPRVPTLTNSWCSFSFLPTGGVWISSEGCVAFLLRVMLLTRCPSVSHACQHFYQLLLLNLDSPCELSLPNRTQQRWSRARAGQKPQKLLVYVRVWGQHARFPLQGNTDHAERQREVTRRKSGPKNWGVKPKELHNL